MKEMVDQVDNLKKKKKKKKNKQKEDGEKVKSQRQFFSKSNYFIEFLFAFLYLAFLQTLVTLHDNVEVCILLWIRNNLPQYISSQPCISRKR